VPTRQAGRDLGGRHRRVGLAVRATLAIALVAPAACTGFGREACYELQSGDHRSQEFLLSPSQGPLLELPSRDGEALLHVQVHDYALYPWGGGPLPYLWVLPFGLFAWPWYEPLPDDSITIRVCTEGMHAAAWPQFTREEDPPPVLARIDIEPQDVLLHIPGHAPLTPRGIEPLWIWPEGNPDNRVEGILLRYDLPPGTGSEIRWSPTRISLDGTPYQFDDVSLSRTSGWKQWGHLL
jgi:hypothetical protein